MDCFVQSALTWGDKMIYLLSRVGYANHEETANLVIRATDEAAARAIAAEQEYTEIDKSVWTNPALSTCESIPLDGEDRLISTETLCG